MKKLFVITALVCASFGIANATEPLEPTNPVGREIVCYPTDTVKIEKKNENVYAFTQRFYDIERLDINNPSHDTIIVFNDKLEIVCKTRESVHLNLQPGNYIIASSRKFSTMYK